MTSQEPARLCAASHSLGCFRPQRDAPRFCESLTELLLSADRGGARVGSCSTLRPEELACDSCVNSSMGRFVDSHRAGIAYAAGDALACRYCLFRVRDYRLCVPRGRGRVDSRSHRLRCTASTSSGVTSAECSVVLCASWAGCSVLACSAGPCHDAERGLGDILDATGNACEVALRDRSDYGVPG